MLLPDDVSQTMNVVERRTRTLNSRSALNGNEQQIPQPREKETDAIPAVKPILPASPTPSQHTKNIQRQNVYLREENKYLRNQLDLAKRETFVLKEQYGKKQLAYESEIEAIHRGQAQELEYFQKHLQEAVNERNRLQESYKQMEHRYQVLYSDFKASVEEETEKRLSDVAQTIVLSPDKVTTVLPRNALQTIELHINEAKTRELSEARYLTSEVQRITAHLEQEQFLVEEERKNLLRMQNTAREQAELRYKMVKSHLHARWTAALAFIIFAILVLLIALQYLFLFLFQVHFVTAITFSIIAPVVLCILLAVVLSRPIAAMQRQYMSAPHKKKVKDEK